MGRDSRGGDRGPRGRRFARGLLRRCAPRDAEVAWEDLKEERRFWTQLLLVCAWGLRDRFAGRTLRPFHALRMALRGLRRTPGTAVAAAATLGVGLTATVALLGTFFGSFRPLPVPDGRDVVQLRLLDARGERVPMDEELFARWRAGSGPLMGVGATRSRGVTVALDGGGVSRASLAAVTPGTFELLGVPPLRGRLPSADPADADAVVVREDLWRDLAPDGGEALGATLLLDGRATTVVGVMAADFGFPESQSLWTVLPEREVAGADQVIGRLRPGVGQGEAMRALTGSLVTGPRGDGAPGADRVRVLDYVAERGGGDEALAFAAVGALVALLLIICTANASTLLLVRAVERVGTLAVHSALGASRPQVVLQLLLEATLIAGVGGALGLVGGGVILAWSEAVLAPHWGYYWMRMELQPGVVVGTAVVVLGCALVAGTLPAVQAVRADLRGVLINGTGRSGSAGGRRVGRWFVGLQVTLSTAGLVVALILTQGFRESESLLASLPTDRMALATVTLDAAETDENRRVMEALREQLDALPGARSAALSVGIPGFGGGISGLEFAEAPTDGEGRLPRVWWIAADPELLPTWQIPLLAGRGIEDGDVADGAPVAVVTRSFAERWLPGQDPLGQRLRLQGVHEGEAWARVVGVVDDWMSGGERVRADQVILPLAQVTPGRLFVSAQAHVDAAALVPGLRDAVRRASPGLAPDQVQTMDGFLAWLIRMPRAIGGFGAAGGFAGVIVASIGLFGVVSFRVRARLPAVGVRMALGAGRGRILGEILVEAARGVAPWVVAGLALGLLISPATMAFSFGAPTRSPGTYLAAGALMLGVVVMASLLPALRAARLDPLTVLRGE